MSPLRTRFLQDMQLHGYSPKTQACYVGAVRSLAKHYGQSPDLITEEQLRQYFLYLTMEKKPPVLPLPSPCAASNSFSKTFFEYIGDERSLCFAVFERILNPHRENGPLPLFITLPQCGIATKGFSKPDQLAMLLRLQSDDVGVNPKWTAIMLNTSHAHRPTLREWFRATLFLKSKSIEDRPRADEETVRIENCQINDALPPTTWNRSAANMLNLQLWFDTSEGSTKQTRNFCDRWVVSAKLGGH
jgi:hypothetical protein